MEPSKNSEYIQKFITAVTNAQLVRFTRAQLNEFTSNFQSEKLGAGGFGVVYKGQISECVKLAVKVLQGNTVMNDMEEQFMAEVGLMAKIHHRNLVKLLGFCFEDDMKALVYEFMENGSLDKILYDSKLNRNWAKFHTIAVETAKGLAYLHDGCDERIIHHNIKPGNILLDKRLSPKIGDIGLARLWNRDASVVAQSRIRGTSGFVAPEVFQQWDAITEKCDVFNFGMMLFEILSRKKNMPIKWFPGRVWDMYDTQQLDEIIVECGIGEDDTEKAKALAEIALWCVQYMPEDRPPMSSVVKMLEGEMQPAPPPNPFPQRDKVIAPAPEPTKKKKKKKEKVILHEPVEFTNPFPQYTSFTVGSSQSNLLNSTGSTCSS